MDTMLAQKSVSVTELKRNYAEVLRQAADDPVAVLNHNKPEAYLVPAAYYQSLLRRIEDLEDAKLMRERAAGPFVAVKLDDI